MSTASPMTVTTAQAVQTALAALVSPAKAEQMERYMRAVPGGYGEGDRFRGLTMPQVRGVVRRSRLDDDEREQLVASPWHEDRMAALLVAVAEIRPLNRVLERARAGGRVPDARIRAAQERQAELGSRYLKWVGRGRVNNWDLVDASAEHLVGPWLLLPRAAWTPGSAGASPPLPEQILDLASSGSLWERRVAVLATFATTRAGVDWPAYAVASLLLADPEDLIHKAVGWMLREAGKRVDEEALRAFLDAHAASMPRTMLRYAVERLDPEVRAAYLAAPRAPRS
ncbi:DNA alkylation repair protein [Actinomyces howellii]|uniref:DNA alkylation repair enzyme n=1 Tax=Actinomyces howellii TaxID=52771 RepID=A0A3S4REA6_9ACTO|nr:DNA alkylation repair protein [Actinomyces howellii]VEG26206.1 DNA alkylation repair enzyme [Actinomyces howellii]